jgi:hypothetical protein
MKKYCVIEGSTVINVIVAESQEIAEQITGKQCIESEDRQITIGSVLVDDILKPHASWVLNSENVWVPPIPEPTFEEGSGQYAEWNHETNTWDTIQVEPAP